MIELLDYYPYGTERLSWSSTSDDGEADTQKTYIGEYSDEETSLSYLNARYYDPQRGQFLSQDPVFVNLGTGDKRGVITLLDPQMMNSYLYGRGNPLILMDPSGEMPQWMKNALSVSDSATQSFMNFMGGIVPIVSDVRDIIGALSSYDIVTGSDLTEQQRMDYGFFVSLPLISGSMMRWGDELTSLTRRAGDISSAIANGHAFQKHIIQEGNFKGLIENKNQFADYIKNVMEKPTVMEKINNGRVKYWDANNHGIVIYDPKSADQGTAFQAWNGKDSYDAIK